MLKAVTWCAKCLFIYFLVAIAAIRFSWVFATPVWQLATKMQWTHLNRLAYLLSYFLPIFAATGFIIGLIPLGKLGKALSDLFRTLLPSAAKQLPPEPDAVPPILWAWLPVTLAFLIRFTTWQSRNSSVFDTQRSVGPSRAFLRPSLWTGFRSPRRQMDHRPLHLHRPDALSHGVLAGRSASPSSYHHEQSASRRRYGQRVRLTLSKRSRLEIQHRAHYFE